ncbi:MAG: hypothetical protein ACTSPB_00310 [Candidatus Thorarchaeota archaeon]
MTEQIVHLGDVNQSLTNPSLSTICGHKEVSVDGVGHTAHLFPSRVNCQQCLHMMKEAVLHNEMKMLEGVSDLPSETFECIVSHMGSIVVNCTLCGRTHFENDENLSWEEGEYEFLIKSHEKEPDRFIAHQYSISWGWIVGEQAVIGCPCKLLGYYEGLFWLERHTISKYLTTITDEALKTAQREANKATDLAKAIESKVN